jgi:hypothetical protein
MTCCWLFAGIFVLQSQPVWHCQECGIGQRTVQYLGIEVDDALEMAEQTEV